MSRPNVVVVGAGLSGLAAATSLARAGASVTVLEKSAAVGGRARALAASGFVFNQGPHALYDGPARAFLRALGVPFKGDYRPGGHLVRAGRRHTLPLGPWSLLTTGALGLGGRVEAARWLSGLGRLDTAPFAGTTWASWLERHIVREEVRQLLLAFSRLSSYANHPRTQSAGAALDQLRLATRGVLYLDGGWQSLVDGLLEVAREAGVALRTRARVALVEGSLRPSVRLEDGARLPADSVLLAVDPATASRLVPQSASLAGAAARSVPVRAASLDLALRRLPRPDRTFALGLDRPLYFSVHSTSARLAPRDGALVHVSMYLGEHTPPGAAEIESELVGFLDDLQPGWTREAVVRRFVPVFTVASALVSAAHGGLQGRPDAVVADAPSVFLAGDWVGPEGQLADAALASARRAADAIAGRYALRRAV